MKKRILIFLLMLSLIPLNTQAKDINSLSSPSAILMDGYTGKVLFEKQPDQKMPPASVTKIMTMLLVMEAENRGEISFDDIVTVSENAAKKEGSHIFLSVGEQISIRDLMKGVAVASGNDASIALGEHLSGSHEEFVKKMNERAKELNMTNTHFVNCNGLDAEGHLTTARDIGKMTVELLKHPKIFEFTTIWMDTLRNGTFGLANTNKLIRFYDGANGMKTGSTSKAGCCISATALRDGMQLVAVIMGAPNSQERFSDASTLLNYGFGGFENAVLGKSDSIYKYLEVSKGIKQTVGVALKNDFTAVVGKGKKDGITSVENLSEMLNAPVKKGQVIGDITYYDGKTPIGKVDVVACEDIHKISFLYAFEKLLFSFVSL
ncbi:MAG: D-alanyl-D-alanine carboxypeptidase [Clostridia bacterium]|nr:D-alanyl-D-alanine carboxypeptidase [Clostridia bacterium]